MVWFIIGCFFLISIPAFIDMVRCIYILKSRNQERRNKMFRCQKCQKNVETHQPQNELVVETRTRPNGSLEIAKRLMVCPDCYLAATGIEPKHIILLTKPIKERENPAQWHKDSPNKRKQPKVEIIKTISEQTIKSTQFNKEQK